MSVLTPREQALYDVAKGSLPSILFSDDANQQEVLAAFAKQFAAVWDECEKWLQDTFIGSASTDGLDQHAIDRGTRRRASETNESLIYRLQFMLEETVTVSGIREKVTQILTGYGVTIPTGYPGILELRRDRAFWNAGDGLQINCIDPALISDGETFTVDGVVYEFNKAGGITAGRTEVSLIGAISAQDVAISVAAALEARYPSLVVRLVEKVAIRRAPGAFSDTVADAGFVMLRQKSYLSRGFRFAGNGSAATVILIILPYGTSSVCAAAVAEAVRQAKAGGVGVIVERRLNP